MPADSPQPLQDRWPIVVLKRKDQLVAGALLIVGLILLGLYWGYQSLWGRGLIDIDHAQPHEIQFLTDINEADWPELALLPNVGERLAKRIVEYRDSHGPFRDLDQLKDVRGIGPKTFDSVKPYLVPIPDVEATAGEASGADDRKS
ncbi:MAG TPA: helix-hairpin-helix domain-containing protein [Pirellulaceae bacterium]|nr:helix-hairpin-helix domain-containing protein [Pirellulaceae bacterium]